MARVSPGRLTPRIGTIILLGDVLALVGAAAIAAPSPVRWWTWALFALVVVVLGVTGLYRLGIAPSIYRDAGALIACVAVPLAGLAAYLGGSESGELLRTGVLAGAFLLIARAICYQLLRYMRARGVVAENSLIIGAGSVGAHMAEILLEHPEYGLEPVGFLDEFEDPGLPAPILGSVKSLEPVLAEYDVRRVIIAFGATRDLDMVPVVRACDRASVDIHVLPRFFELGFAAKGRDVDDVWGMPLLRLRRAALRSYAWNVKRAFDVVIASLMLLLAAPVYAAVALAVRLSSPGPVYLRQRRIGQRGEVIEVLKFRSMRQNADSDTQWSVSNDDRTTPVGRVIRKLSLDELPQLLNVIRGQMSLVGPRPERPYFVNRFKSQVPRYGDRHRVPVGLSGLAQVHGLRGDTSIPERARFDNQYIENWSLWWDIVILVKTVGAVIRDARQRKGPGAASEQPEPEDPSNPGMRPRARV